MRCGQLLRLTHQTATPRLVSEPAARRRSGPAEGKILLIHRFALALAIGIAVVAIGCGGQSATNATSAPPAATHAAPAVTHAGAVTDHTADGVRVLLKQFVHDLRAGHYAAACQLMTPQQRAKLATATQTSCSRALAAARKAVGDAQLARDEDAINSLPVSVTGNHATSPNPESSGETSHYVYRAGRWRIG